MSDSGPLLLSPGILLLVGKHAQLWAHDARPVLMNPREVGVTATWARLPSSVWEPWGGGSREPSKPKPPCSLSSSRLCSTPSGYAYRGLLLDAGKATDATHATRACGPTLGLDARLLEMAARHGPGDGQPVTRCRRTLADARQLHRRNRGRNPDRRLTLVARAPQQQTPALRLRGSLAQGREHRGEDDTGRLTRTKRGDLRRKRDATRGNAHIGGDAAGGRLRSPSRPGEQPTLGPKRILATRYPHPAPSCTGVLGSGAH